MQDDSLDWSLLNLTGIAGLVGGAASVVVGQPIPQPEPEPEPESGPPLLHVFLRTAWETYAGEVCEVQRRVSELEWPKATTQRLLIMELEFMHAVVTGCQRGQLDAAQTALRDLAIEAEVSLAAFPQAQMNKFAAFLSRCLHDARDLVIRPRNNEWVFQAELFDKLKKGVLTRLDSHLNAGAARLGFLNTDGLAASARFTNTIDTSRVDKSRLLEVDLIFRCVDFSASDEIMSGFGVKVLNSGLFKGYRVCRNAKVFVVNTAWLASCNASLDQYLASKNAARVADPIYVRDFPGCALAWAFPQDSAASFVENIGADYWSLDTGS